MAYETCPQCGAQKHQLVACSQCGFKRRPTRAARVHLGAGEQQSLPSQKDKPVNPPPVSSNFENCPACGQRKHLLMACPSCGFTRTANHDRRKSAEGKSPPPRPHHEYQHRPIINSPYDNSYYGPNLVEEDSCFPVWKRPIPSSKKSAPIKQMPTQRPRFDNDLTPR